MGSNSASNGDTADFGRTTPTKKEKKKTASVEMGLGTDRMSNYSVTQGGTRQEGNGNRNGNQIVQSTTTPPPVAPSPTVAEVSQSTATDADVYDPRKTKRKGRSATIITSAQGVDQNFTLGKQSLLGRA